MVNDDTIKLLKECNAGVKMAVSSIDELLDKVQDEALKNRLIENKNDHSKLGDETHQLLLEYHDQDKEPNAIAKAMSWMKTNYSMMKNNSDSEVAKLIIDGSTMGIQSLRNYLDQYQAADEQSKGIAKKLIHIEETLSTDLQKYL
ncbi:MAG: hypothetical protein Q4F05_09765 [bacterium]|nr:hypothetical protein [bacterium]